MRAAASFLLAILASFVLLLPRTSRACGLTPPIGPNGFPTVCHGEATSIRFHAGLSVGGTSTTIDFGDRRADLLQAASVASLDVMPLDALTLSVSAGASLGGRVDYLGARYDLRPGWLGGVGISYRLFGRGGLPFVQPSLSYSFARATSVAPGGAETDFTANDWRAGLVVGKAIGGFAAPYVLARYFGAGTDWSVGGGHGGDHFRYHAGIGSAFAFSEHVDAIAELAVLGERRATLGVGYMF
ncbi:hypothetical protein [Pendulispora albinea]|uniref:Outer membrane protein beta-barrel domain-containing protein n=1 Tax=Pendulispora albinea TaxID=2741071 RepID=A0ABZ2LX98_9BACT